MLHRYIKYHTLERRTPLRKLNIKHYLTLTARPSLVLVADEHTPTNPFGL